MSTDWHLPEPKAVGLVWNPKGKFWYVIRSDPYYHRLMTMQSKLLRAKVDWKSHIVLTWSPEDIKMLQTLDDNGGLGVSVQWGRKVMDMAKAYYINKGWTDWANKMQWFCKYEVGTKGTWANPHLHILTTWNQHKKLMEAVIKKLWVSMGFGGSVKKGASKTKRFAICRVTKIKHEKHLTHIIQGEYYVLSYQTFDVLKPSGVRYLKKGRQMYSFSFKKSDKHPYGIEFTPEKEISEKKRREWMSPFKAIRLLEKTGDNLIDFWDKEGLHGKTMYKKQFEFIKDNM